MADNGFNRIGGWLILLAFFLGVMVPFAQLSSAMSLYKHSATLSGHFSEAWLPYKNATLAVITIKALLSFYVAYRLINSRDGQTPKIVIIATWTIFVGLSIVGLLINSILSPSAFDTETAVRLMIWPIIISVCITLYLLKSKRVAATYK